MDAAINIAAAAQRAQSTGRFGAEGREIYNACSQFPTYSQCPGFPNLSPEELHHQSKPLWRSIGTPPAPLLDGCGESPHPVTRVSVGGH